MTLTQFSKTKSWQNDELEFEVIDVKVKDASCFGQVEALELSLGFAKDLWLLKLELLEPISMFEFKFGLLQLHALERGWTRT